MHVPTKARRGVLLALLAVLAFPTRAARAQSATPEQGPSEAVAEPSETSSRQTIGWIVAGAGGVSLLGSGCVMLLRNQKRNDIRAEEGGTDLVNDLAPYQTAATALLVAGVAGLAVGLPLALVGDSDTHLEVSIDHVVVTGTF